MTIESAASRPGAEPTAAKRANNDEMAPTRTCSGSRSREGLSVSCHTRPGGALGENGEKKHHRRGRRGLLSVL